MRLRDCPSVAFNWRDLLVVCRHLGRDSALYKALNPEDDTSWSVSEYLLASVADALNLRLWQAAGNKGTRPKPIPRPTDEKPKQYGTAEPVEDIIEWIQSEMATMTASDPRRERRKAIRADLEAGEPRRVIAERYGVSVSTVGRIARAM